MSGPILLALRILLAAALYAFLLLALWLMWRELRRSARQLSGSGQPPLILAYQVEGSPRTFRYAGLEMIIGRDPTCTLSLDDKTISARHSRLSYHHAQWWCEDLHSTNGTFLNTEPVNGPIVITSGDRLCCGELEFEITIESI